MIQLDRLVLLYDFPGAAVAMTFPRQYSWSLACIRPKDSCLGDKAQLAEQMIDHL